MLRPLSLPFKKVFTEFHLNWPIKTKKDLRVDMSSFSEIHQPFSPVRVFNGKDQTNLLTSIWQVLDGFHMKWPVWM